MILVTEKEKLRLEIMDRLYCHDVDKETLLKILKILKKQKD